MNKHFLLPMISILLLLSVAGCSSGSDEKVTLYEMESFFQTKQGSAIVITDRSIVELFRRTHDEAIKNFGVSDMLPPHYKVELQGLTYLLWLYEEAGVLQNIDNRHTTYSIRKTAIPQLNEVIKSYYPNTTANDATANAITGMSANE